MLSGAKKKGNMIYKTVYGYQKVRHQDGTPVTFTSEYNGEEMINHVYKLINLYGDNPYTTEFYPDFRKSVLDNGTAKIDSEIPDADIINHFAPQLAEDIAKFTEKTLPLQPMKEAPKAVSGEREYTPEKLTKENMPANGVFVFGSNTEGRHGAGAALTAKEKFGAKQGQAEGLQGKSFAIITKDLAKGKRSVSLEKIQDGIVSLLSEATKDPSKKFYVTKIGSDLAGYSLEEIKGIFKKLNDAFGINDNIILPKEYEVRPITKSKTKELFSFEKAIAQKSFRSKPLEFLDKIPTQKDTIVAMRNNRETGVISIDQKAMVEKFNDKAWTKPAKQLDDSFATPLAEDEFKSPEEWFTFALIHEVKHDTILKEEDETTGQYEDRINQAALEDLRSNYAAPSVTEEFPDKQLDIKDEKCK